MLHLLRKVALACFGLCLAGALIAQGREAPQARVSLNLQDAELRTALRLLVQQTQADVCYVASDKPYSLISLTLTDQPFETALKYICQSAGAEYERNDDGVYVIMHKGERPVVAPIPIVEEPVAPVPLPKRIEKIQLRNVGPDDIIRWLNPKAPIAEMLSPAQVRAYYSNANKPIPSTMLYSLNGNALMQVSPNNNTIPPAVPMENPIADVLGSQRSPDSDVLNAQRLGGGGGGGFAGQPGGGGGTGGQPGTGTGAQTNLIPDGVDSVQAFMADNSLIVRGNDTGIEELRRLIKLFDVPAKQLMIKIEFITTSSNYLKQYGINWSFQRVNFNSGANLAQGETVFINYGSGNIVAALRADLVQGKGRVVNSPIVTTMNNVPATIFENTQLTYFINVPVVTNNQVVSFAQPTQITISTGLSITPRANADGTVTMLLQPTVTDLGQVRRSPSGIEVPDQIQQSVSALRRIKSGETMVIGGLTRKTESSNVTKIPFLGDLPIIGSLFRNNKVQRDDSELLIFVTPMVLEDPVPSGSSVVFP